MRGTTHETVILLGRDRTSCFALVLMPTAEAQTDGQGVVVVPTTETQAVDAFSIEDYYFEPTDAVVDLGTTLMWVNSGQEQHATIDDGQLDSGVLTPGDSFMTAVKGSGTLTDHCTLHPETTGSITTVGSPSPRATLPPPKRRLSPKRRLTKTRRRRDTPEGKWYS